MKLYSENKSYKLYQGNMLDMLDVIDKKSIDAVLTDPPYELNFMGKGWDNTSVSFNADTWKKCFEVLKPGGYLLAFGGSRTYHRIACAIEDAGFEIRDTIMWLYGSGFPKSMALDKALEGKITTGNANKTQFHKLSGKQADKHHYGFTTSNKEQGFRPKDYTTEGESTTYLKELEPTTELAKKYSGYGTCLKPSFEPIIVARKPFKGSLVDNVIEYGVGGINIDECRVETTDVNRKGGATTEGNLGWKPSTKTYNDGRFPANTILTYDETDFDEVCGGFPKTKSGKITGKEKFTKTNNIFGKFNPLNTERGFGDNGSASRYFMNCKYTGKDEEFRRYIYTPKASKKDRDEGLEEFEEKKGIRSNAPRKNEEIKTKPRKNTHPTVKPTELMQYLVRLVTPNGGTVFDPFNGSGSTGKAVMYENKERNKNYKYIGIELTEEYLPIAQARIEYVCNLKEKEQPQTTIFDYIGDSNE